MADYPCDAHNARYSGPSNRTYIRVYRDDQMLELKLSVCEACLDLLLEPWSHGCLGKPESGYWVYIQEPDQLERLWKARSEPVEALNGSKRF
jgi:hypothetical protein